jgi:hypothetical protein
VVSSASRRCGDIEPTASIDYDEGGKANIALWRPFESFSEVQGK